MRNDLAQMHNFSEGGFHGDTFQMKMTNQKTTNNKNKQIHGVEMLNHTLSPESGDKIHHSQNMCIREVVGILRGTPNYRGRAEMPFCRSLARRNA